MRPCDSGGWVSGVAGEQRPLRDRAARNGDATRSVIANLSTPDMDGAEMVRRIRTTRPDLKVLYVTRHIDSLMNVRPLWEGEAFLK